MKHLQVKKIEGCLEGTNVKDILWDGEVTREFIDYISILGKLIINDTIGKPFYKLIIRGQFSVKGAIGTKSSRVVFGSESNPEDFDKFIRYCEAFV